MFESLGPTAALNNTFLLLMGDHGYRDTYRPTGVAKTEQGNIENNMPGLMVLPPAGLARDRPEMLASLQANAGVLTAQWDIARLLREVLALSTGRPEEELFRGQPSSGRGISLLHPIPARSCPEAGVPMDSCSCPSGLATLEPAKVEGLVKAALADTDAFLEPMWGCLRLQDHVANISEVVLLSHETKGTIRALVRLTVPPVEFRVKVHYSLTDVEAVSANLVRTDRYAETALCVPAGEPRARPLCVCPPAHSGSDNGTRPLGTPAPSES
jgi:hypothetical protein